MGKSPERPPVRIEYSKLTCGIELESTELGGNANLLIGLQRAFEKLNIPIPHGGKLVSLGIGREPYLEALKLFAPSTYLGVDSLKLAIESARERWENHSYCLGFNPQFVAANATQPLAVFEAANQQPELVDIVALIHPETPDEDGESERDSTNDILRQL